MKKIMLLALVICSSVTFAQSYKDVELTVEEITFKSLKLNDNVEIYPWSDKCWVNFQVDREYFKKLVLTSIIFGFPEEGDFTSNVVEHISIGKEDNQYGTLFLELKSQMTCQNEQDKKVFLNSLNMESFTLSTVHTK